VKLTGFAELEKKLEVLSKAAGKAAMRKSLKAAAQPIVVAAQGSVPVASGALKNSMDVSTKLAPRQAKLHKKAFRDDRSSVEMFIGPSYNLGAGGRHGHLVEFGTYKTAPRPFMRPAWDAGSAQMLTDLGKNIGIEIDKAIGRAARRAAKSGG